VIIYSYYHHYPLLLFADCSCGLGELLIAHKHLHVLNQHADAYAHYTLLVYMCTPIIIIIIFYFYITRRDASAFSASRKRRERRSAARFRRRSLQKFSKLSCAALGQDLH